MTKNTSTPGYDHLYDILARRMSVRRLKPDPIPDDYVHRILEPLGDVGREFAALGICGGQG